MRRELPGRMRGELEVRIERALIPVEESLKQQLVGIVQELQVRLFEEFKQNYRQANSAGAINNALAAGDVAAETSSGPNQMLYSPATEDGKGKGKDVMIPFSDNHEVHKSSMEDVWGVSQPMDIALPSYPFIMDDPAAFLDDVAEEGGHWDSQWTNATYSTWM